MLLFDEKLRNTTNKNIKIVFTKSMIKVIIKVKGGGKNVNSFKTPKERYNVF